MAINYQGGYDVSLAPLYQGLSNIMLRNEEALRRQAAEEQKQQQARNTQLSNQIAKVNPDGIRPADVERYNQLATEIRNKAIETMNEPDQTKRMRGDSELNSLINEAKLWTSQSKQMSKLQVAIGNTLLSMDADDESINRFQELSNASLDKLPPNAFDAPSWKQPRDFAWADELINKELKDLVSQVEKEIKVAKGPAGWTRAGQFYNTEGELSPEIAGERILQLYNYNRKFRETFNEQFPDIPVEEAIMQVIEQKKPEGRLKSTTAVKFQAAAAPRASSGEGGATTGSLVFDVPITIGNQRVVADRRIGANISNVSLPLGPAIDAQTGEVVDLQSLVDEGYSKGNITAFLRSGSFGQILGEDEVAQFVVTTKNPLGSIFGQNPNISRVFYVGQDLVAREGTNSKPINKSLNTLRSGTSGQQSTSANATPTNSQTAPRRTLSNDLINQLSKP